MIDTVSTLSVNSSSARYIPSAAISAVSPIAEAPSALTHHEFSSSAIRVDNLQNAVILEYRSSEGEVVRQYPTQSQIEAFHAAERIRTHTTSEAPSAPTPQEAPATVQPAIVGAVSGGSVAAPSAPTSGAGASAPTQSVVV